MSELARLGVICDAPSAFITWKIANWMETLGGQGRQKSNVLSLTLREASAAHHAMKAHVEGSNTYLSRRAERVALTSVGHDVSALFLHRYIWHFFKQAVLFSCV